MAAPDFEYNLPACPSSPNCVSSQATGNHCIEPFPVTAGEAEAAWERLREILGQREDTVIVSANDKVLQVEFKTVLGFVDDGLFYLDDDNRLIHVRSASRSGYWDVGKNRRRLEEIRQQYTKRGETIEMGAPQIEHSPSTRKP